MKHILSLLLAAVLLLSVTGCGRSPASGGAGAGASSAPSPASSGVVSPPDPIREPDPEPAAPARSPTDYDNRFYMDFCFGVVETSSALVGKGMMHGYLVYSDKETGEGGYLCGRPECSHTDETCNAFIGRWSGWLNAYDGKLYWVGQDVASKTDWTEYLWRMDEDGTNRVKVKELTRVQEEYGVINALQLHRGRVVLLTRNQLVADGVPVEEYHLFSSGIDDSQDFTALWEASSSDGMDVKVRTAGEYVYVSTVLRTDGTEDWEAYRASRRVFRIRLDTGEREELFAGEDLPLALDVFYVTRDEQVYLGTADYRSSTEHPLVQVWRVENGGLIEAVSFRDEGWTINVPSLTEGLVRCLGLDENGVRSLWYQDYEGSTLYKGPLDRSVLPNPDVFTGGLNMVMGGEKDWDVILFQDGVTQEFYFVRLDLAGKPGTQTLLAATAQD